MKHYRNPLLGILSGYGICLSLKIIKLRYFNQRLEADDVTPALGAKSCPGWRFWGSVLLNQINGDALDKVFKFQFNTNKVTGIKNAEREVEYLEQSCPLI